MPDMSPEAIRMRLLRVSQLRKLCLSLGKARRKSDSTNRKPSEIQNEKGRHTMAGGTGEQ